MRERPVADAHPLVCPTSGQPLTRLPSTEVRRRQRFTKDPLTPLRKTSSGDPAPPVGVTPEVLLRADGGVAYPVVDGVPVLLAPEALGPASDARAFNLADIPYAEAYQEMTFYNNVSSEEAKDILRSEAYRAVEPAAVGSPRMVDSFPDPTGGWLDAVYDCVAQWEAYAHLRPLQDRRVLQLGGKGVHAVKFLLAGAAESWVLTPMLGEARCARALAEAVGVSARLRCAVGLAEELPFADDNFDAVYAGGCLHHTVTSLVIPQVRRVLTPGGRFAATDPWRAPLYAVGTMVFGKREANSYCRPLTPERVGPVHRVFGSSGEIYQHGSLTRYPMLALHKLGFRPSLRAVWRLTELDDRICSRLGVRSWGSSVVCLGTK